MKLQPKENKVVLWGTNLSSTVGRPPYSENVSHIVRIPAFHQSVITGLILSDGWLSFASKKNQNARLGFKQSLAHSGYFWSVFNYLGHYCSSIPTFVLGIRNDTKTYALLLQTIALPCFTELRTLWYPKGKKIVPENIYDLLTPIALAHLIQGDGTTKGWGLTLCTESFHVQDQVRLINVLILKYELKCTLHKQRNSYNIYNLILFTSLLLISFLYLQISSTLTSLIINYYCFEILNNS
jgi:LAGLIDADG DNA endonuclease family